MGIILSLLAQQTYSDWTLNKFDCKKCDSILKLNSEASKTLRAIMTATKVATCSEFNVDSKKMTSFSTIDLHGKGLSDLSPFHLFRFIDGSIDLSNNNITDVEPLINASHGLYRINLSHNKIKDAAYLAKHFSIALVLDSNEIDDPAELGNLYLVNDFSLRGNRSTRGPDYDRALESLYRFYALFPKEFSGKKNLDFSGMKLSLAPVVLQYISMKNVKVEDIIADAERYYCKKGDADFRINLKTFAVKRKNDSVLATYSLTYRWNDYDFNIPDDEAGDYSGIYRTKKVAASAEVLFDSSFKIVSYIEKIPPREQYTVIKKTWGMTDIADVVKLLSFSEDSVNGKKITLPVGSILKADFELVNNSAGGKFGSDDVFSKFIYNGTPLWIRTSSSENGEFEDCLKNVKR